MISIDLAPCYARFDECARQAIRDNPTANIGLTAVVAQLQSRRQVTQWIGEISCFLKFLEPGDRILDFGAGSGISAIPFAYAGCQVDAIDITQETPAFIGARHDPVLYQDTVNQQKTFWPYLERAFPGASFQHYKNTIPFPDATFKAIMAFGVLEHIPDTLHAPVIKELRRVLKPGGYLFISYLPRKLALCEWVAIALRYYHHERLWGDREAKRFLKGKGFDICLFKRVVTAPQHPAAFSNRHERLFNFIDWAATIPPLDVFSHHMRIVARKR